MSDKILCEMSEDGGKTWKTLVVGKAYHFENDQDAVTPDGVTAYYWKVDGVIMPEKSTHFKPEWMELLKDKNVE